MEKRIHLTCALPFPPLSGPLQMQPRKCSPGQACPAGSTAATPDPVLFAIILAASVLCVSAPQMLELYIRRRQVVTQRATNKQIAVAKNTKTVSPSARQLPLRCVPRCRESSHYGLFAIAGDLFYRCCYCFFI